MQIETYYPTCQHLVSWEHRLLLERIHTGECHFGTFLKDWNPWPPFVPIWLDLWWRDFLALELSLFFNFEGRFRGLFHMYDLNGVYHEKADVGGIPKMW